MNAQPLLDFDAPPPARVESELRRELGITRAAHRAARHAPGWEDDAVEAVRKFAETHESFATEDVREQCGTPADVDPRAWGAVVRRAASLGYVVADGAARVNSSNRSFKVRWRSLVFRVPA